VDRGSWSAQRWDLVYVCTDWREHGHEPRYADADRRTIAGQWRRVSGAPHPVAEAAMASTPARASVLTLGLLLGGIEAGTGRHSWRRPTATTRSYFATLERWGYVLSDVERLVLADPDSDHEADARNDAGTEAEKAERPAAGEQPDAATADSNVEGAAERLA